MRASVCIRGARTRFPRGEASFLSVRAPPDEIYLNGLTMGRPRTILSFLSPDSAAMRIVMWECGARSGIAPRVFAAGSRLAAFRRPAAAAAAAADRGRAEQHCCLASHLLYKTRIMPIGERASERAGAPLVISYSSSAGRRRRRSHR